MSPLRSPQRARALLGRLRSGRAAALLRRRIGRHPLHVWVLWAVGLLLLASCPIVFSDPGMWAFLVDPELLVLLAVMCLQQARTQAGIAWLRLRLWRDRTDTG